MIKYLILILFSFPAYALTIDNSEHNITMKQPVQRAFAYAPNIISKCSGSLAGGAQGQFAGISFAGSYKDEFCERVELIKLAIAMGHDEEADELFYQFPMVLKLDKEKELCDYPTKCTRLGR